jgi:hypothetical protein
MTTAEHYARHGQKLVHGWLDTPAALAIVALARSQKISGGACEIGVHHGRLFTLLHLLTEGPSVAIDLFDAQEDNLDHSGCGSKDMLLRNVARFGDIGRVRIIPSNSLTVNAGQILQLAEGPLRLFSVDGGHGAEVTYNDMRLALETTRQGALIVLDDYFNSGWPGVSEGACQFMREQRGFSPVLIVGNKFIFAHGDASPYFQTVPGEVSTVFGMPVKIAPRRNFRSRVARSALWRLIKSKRHAAAVRAERAR